MKLSWKRIGSFLLSVCMILSMIPGMPIGVFADDRTVITYDVAALTEIAGPKIQVSDGGTYTVNYNGNFKNAGSYFQKTYTKSVTESWVGLALNGFSGKYTLTFTMPAKGGTSVGALVYLLTMDEMLEVYAETEALPSGKSSGFNTLTTGRLTDETYVGEVLDPDEASTTSFDVTFKGDSNNKYILFIRTPSAVGSSNWFFRCSQLQLTPVVTEEETTPSTTESVPEETEPVVSDKTYDFGGMDQSETLVESSGGWVDT